MKAWITKYALTSGVEIVEVEPTSFPTMVSQVTPRGEYSPCYHKPDWHETEEEAKDQVKKMIAAKRRSIQKQLNKLKEISDSLEFCQHLPMRKVDKCQA